MPFSGNENHFVGITEAEQLTANYRNANPNALLGGFFGQAAIQAVLSQPGCVGIRYYFAQNADGTPTLVLTGTDANMNDLWQGIVLDMSMPCPRFCSTPNPLNSSNPNN